MLKTIGRSIREFKRTSFLCSFFEILEVFLECTIPFTISLLVNEIKGGAGLDTILRYGGILIVMAALSLTFGILAGNFGSTASCGVARNLRHDLFYKIQNFSFENIDRFHAPSLVTRLTTDITNVQNAYMMLIRTAVRSPLMLTFAFIMSFVMGGRLALIFVVVAPALGFGLGMVIKKTFPLFRRVFRKYDVLNASVQENVRAIRVVKSFNREEYEKEKFDRSAEEVRQDFTKAERILAFNGPMMQACLYAVMVFVMYYGSYRIISTMGLAIDIGQFSSILTYSFMILNALMMFSMVFTMITMAQESLRRIAEVLAEEPAITSPADEAETEIADGSVVFDHVTFRYAKSARKAALDDIDLVIPSGSTVGIIGSTGSAKTTLIQLIPRLYDVSEGSVSVGGLDVRSYDLKALRDAVALVLQKNTLFAGTIIDNMRWGNEEATLAEIEDACRLAEADEFIQQFPDKYNTWIEQGGSNVSGGQKQRLCIARAILKKPKILILDDSTSAVDTKTDARIRHALRTTLPETTKIIIAQRVASIEEADRIVVMDGGRISDMGTHEELLEKSSIYREIYESQTRAQGKEEEISINNTEAAEADKPKAGSEKGGEAS